MDKLTTDNPKTNTETLLNYAFGKENKVYLRESEEGLELCEYVAGLCSGHAGCISEEDIMDGACMDCRGCSAGTLYFCAIQAAELRARLKAYEDSGLSPEEVALMARREEWEPMAKITRISGVPLDRLVVLARAEAEGRLMVLPCKVGDTVYEPTNRGIISEYKIRAFRIESFDSVWAEWDIIKGFVYRNLYGFNVDEIGKTVFLTREAAEAALKEVQG